MLKDDKLKVEKQWISYALGAFCFYDLDPRVLLEESVTAYQYKVILTDNLYPRKHFRSDGFFLLCYLSTSKGWQ